MCSSLCNVQQLVQCALAVPQVAAVPPHPDLHHPAPAAAAPHLCLLPLPLHLQGPQEEANEVTTVKKPLLHFKLSFTIHFLNLS